MKQFIPESFLVSATAAKTVSRLSPDDCKQWITEVVKNYENFVEKQKNNNDKEPREFQPSFPDSLVGDMIQQTWNAQRAGLISLWKQYRANPSGGPKDIPPG